MTHQPLFPRGYVTLYIVRHGETVWNVEKRIQGTKDSPLTENGINQALTLGAELKHQHFDTVFSSDLLRAHRTAELITLEKKLAISTTDLLREQSAGEDEGITKEEREIKHAALLKAFQTMTDEEKKHVRFNPTAETKAESITRFITFLREVAPSNLGKTVLVVTHAGMMQNLLVHLGFGTLSSFDVKNGAYVILKTDGTDFYIENTKNIHTKVNS